jgi:hypothetical protein
MVFHLSAARIMAAIGQLVLLSSLSVGASTFIVNSADDTDDFDPNSGVTTLRKALRESDFNRGETNLIQFNITGGEPRIFVGSDMGNLGAGVSPVIIDATTQPASGGFPAGTVTLDGSLAGGADPGGAPRVGLSLTAQGVTVKGLTIENFASDGIRLIGSGGPVGYCTIVGNTIRKNGGHGVNIVGTPNNVVGGSQGSDWNTIVENQGDGVHISGSDAGGNKVQGNGIGRDSQSASATEDLTNAGDGVVVDDAPDAVIGDDSPVTDPGPTANKIVGKQRGVRIDGPLATNTRVHGNFIGDQEVEATLAVGVAAHGGNLLSISGDVFTKIDSTEIDVFADFDGSVDIHHNKLMAAATLGMEMNFGEGRDVSVTFTNNLVRSAKTGVERTEAVSGKFDWLASGNDLSTDGPSYRLLFRGSAAAQRTFAGDSLTSSSDLAMDYVYQPSSDVSATLTFRGLIATGGKGGVQGRIEAGSALTVDLEGGQRTGGSGHGDRLTVGAAVTGSVIYHASGVSYNVCGEAGLFLENLTGRSSLCTAFIEHDSMLGNTVGLNILNWKLKNSVEECTITDNTSAGIQLLGDCDADIHDCTFARNGTGVLITDTSLGTLTNDSISENGTGVAVVPTTGSLLLGPDNSIFGNGIGIALGNDGQIPNDLGDTDGFQNYPVLSSAGTEPSGIKVTGTLNSKPNVTFTLTFFSNTVCDPSGFGEGEHFLQTSPVTTDSTGNVTFAVDLAGNFTVGQAITATATDDHAKTSEFSNCISVTPGMGGGGPGGPITVSIQPAASAGQYSDPLSPVLISASDPGANGSALQASVTFQKNGGAVQAGLPSSLALVPGTTSPDGSLPGTRSWTVEGLLQTTPADYAIQINILDGTGGSGAAPFHIVVGPDDALLQYTGALQFHATVPSTEQDVDALVSNVFSGLRLNRSTHTFDCVGSIVNISADTSLSAPMTLVLTKLTGAGVTWANTTGSSTDGLPLLDLAVPSGSLAPGHSIQNIVLKFNNPDLVPFSFETSVRASVPDFTQATADLTLQAQVTDAPDGNKGDVRTASVTFYRDSTNDPNNVLGPGAVPVQLLDPTDTTRGVATTSFTYHLHQAEAMAGTVTFPVLAMASGNFIGTSPAQSISISTETPVGVLGKNGPIYLEASRSKLGTGSDVSRSGGAVAQIRIVGVAHRLCLLQHSNNLIEWSTVTELSDSSDVIEMRRAVTSSNARAFYRVILLHSDDPSAPTQ